MRQLGPRRYQVRRRALEALLAQPQAVVRTLRVLPISRGGRPDGFRLLYLTAQSPLRALGLRRGDVLQAINGRRVATVEALLSVYAKMRQASHVSLGLRRAHRTISLDYAIR
ncbi:MAG: PDZ domain-containing protein [Deltaproteobacteria bacterium]|nr:PDZ domain-containing protein [Deltaproteobacteria bacterium]